MKYLLIAVIRHRNPTVTVFTLHTEGLSHVNLEKFQLTNDFPWNKFTYGLSQSHNWLTLQPSRSILDNFAQFYLYLWSNVDMTHFSDGSWTCVWRPIFQWGEIKCHRKRFTLVFSLHQALHSFGFCLVIYFIQHWLSSSLLSGLTRKQSYPLLHWCWTLVCHVSGGKHSKDSGDQWWKGSLFSSPL